MFSWLKIQIYWHVNIEIKYGLNIDMVVCFIILVQSNKKITNYTNESLCIWFILIHVKYFVNIKWCFSKTLKIQKFMSLAHILCKQLNDFLFPFRWENFNVRIRYFVSLDVTKAILNQLNASIQHVTTVHIRYRMDSVEGHPRL